MAIVVTTPSGVTYSIPEPGDVNWGADLTEFLAGLAMALRSGDTVITTELVMTPVVTNVLNGDILDVTGKSTFRLQASADVALNTTTPLLASSLDGKRVLLIGDSNFTITIPDAGNLNINGECLLERDEFIELIWLESSSQWKELNRSN